MKQFLLFLFFLSIQVSFSQGVINTQLIDSISLKADEFIGVDDFENYYYTKDNTLYKKTTSETYVYTNTQLGIITSIDITNPMKILVFYQNFNTIVILDNRLNELTDSINLSEESFGKNVALATVSSNNNLWLYSLDDNVLSLWDYEQRKIIFDSQPLTFYEDSFEAEKQVSNYEYCWLISEKGVLQFNEFGSFIGLYQKEDTETLVSYQKGMLVKTKKGLFYVTDTKDISISIEDIKHNTNDFFAIRDYLYFFDANEVYKYALLKK